MGLARQPWQVTPFLLLSLFHLSVSLGLHIPGGGPAAFLAKVGQGGSEQGRTQAIASPLFSWGGPLAYLSRGKAGVSKEEILLQRSDSVTGR